MRACFGSYLTLGSGKTWHWAPGPGDSWSVGADLPPSFAKDLREYWPAKHEFQKLIEEERVALNGTAVRVLHLATTTLPPPQPYFLVHTEKVPGSFISAQ